MNSKSDSKRWQNLWGRYRITKAAYERLASRNNGRCEICNSPRNICVDHCHDTSIVRGLVCRGCNAALAAFGDTLAGVRRAINYLQRHERRSRGGSKGRKRSGSDVRSIAVRGLRSQMGGNVFPASPSRRKRDRSRRHARPLQPRVVELHAQRPSRHDGARGKSGGH